MVPVREGAPWDAVCSRECVCVVGACLVCRGSAMASRGVCGGVADRYFGDLVTAWYVIVICGIVVALVFSFVWLLLMKVFTALLVRCTGGVCGCGKTMACCVE